MIVDNYLLDKLIGKGANSEVYLTRKKGSNIKYATKKYSRNKIENTEYFKNLKKEIIILQNIKHPNVIKVEDVKKTKNSFYAVYEYCNGGDLSQILEKYQKKYDKPFSQEIVQYLMKQIIKAFKYIHKKEIVHCDIKLKSILIQFDNDKDMEELNMMNTKVKIAHFKLCHKNDNKNIQKIGIATSNYNFERKYNYKKTDILDLGIICYKMLFGEYALDSEDWEKVINEIKNGKYKYPIILSQEIISFLENMVKKNTFLRFTIEELYKHDFLTKDIKEFKLINNQTTKKEITQTTLSTSELSHLCIFCLTNPIQIIISPCGHKCICDICYIKLKENDKFKECPICRKKIESVVERVYEI